MKYVRSKSLPLNQIDITDRYWSRYIRLVSDVILPYQWDILNDKTEEAFPSGCIENFKIAAGKSEGTFQGAVFQDTDVAKWLEAVAYTLMTHSNKELEDLADSVIDLISEAQCQDGYLNTYFIINEPNLRWTNLKEGHELYTAGHMIEAAVAYYLATNKKPFLLVAEKLADLLCLIFGSGTDQCKGYPGHQEIELALIKLYEVLGKEQYLTLAKHFIDIRGVGENYFLEEEKKEEYKQIFPEFRNYDPSYSQSHLPVRDQVVAEGHSVRATYMYAAMADLAYYYNDDTLLKTCETLWNDIVERQMYITGSIGSSGFLERFTTDYDLPNDRNYSETCATIGLALFGKRMAQITNDAKYIDVVERALYNTLLSGISLDGKSFFYVNPLEVWPANCLENTSLEHVKPVRQKWFGVACCPPNIARTLSSMGQYIYFLKEQTLYVNLYLSNKLELPKGNSTIHLSLESDLLNSGKIQINMSIPSEISNFEVALRIPEYVKKYKISVNDQEIKGEIQKGYLFLRDLPSTAAVQIHFEVPAHFIHAHPKVRADVGKVALQKGPLVYCLEEIDNTENLASIFVDPNTPCFSEFEPNLLNGIVTLSFEGERVVEKDWPQNQLYANCSLPLEPISLKAIPYSSWGNRTTGEMIVWIKENRTNH